MEKEEVGLGGLVLEGWWRRGEERRRAQGELVVEGGHRP